MKRSHQKPSATAPAIRCAIYTRKSTEEGLEQEFNSLDAQRESGEAYIKSQTHEGWECLTGHYDDGGFTGGNMERPALKRLMADIEASKVDCVVVYKVDRLSRSLLDFARMMETFEKQHVSFVSVTQQFNTSTSMGRLVLNVLLSFAQFEREIISERTRDKIAAARRKGKWAGGHPLLGYDIDPRGFKLVVNEDEAFRVRAIFDLYLQHQAMIPVVTELDRRGWLNKRWMTRKAHERGGMPFTKTSLHKLLTNITYTGKLRYKHEIHDGEHDAIVEPATWQRVQVVLQRNGRNGGALVRNKFEALLKGMLRCAPCGCAMIPTHTIRKGNKRYRYYVCSAAQKRGWHTCPSKSVPAGEIEQFIVDQIRCIGQDPILRRETLAQARKQDDDRVDESNAERRGIEKDLRHWYGELNNLTGRIRAGEDNEVLLTKLADLQERIGHVENRRREAVAQVDAIESDCRDDHELEAAFAAFDPMWEALTPKEQAHIIETLVQRVDYDGSKGTVTIIFHQTGIESLHEQLASQRLKEKIA